MIGFLNKNKELFWNLIITFIFAGVIILSMCNSQTLNYDTIWCFHASQKVSNGYIMYSQINTVLTPIFFWIGGLFVKIFGNAVTSLYICSGIIGGLLVTTVYNILKKIDEEKSGILFFGCICLFVKNIYVIATPSYNILALLWWFLAVFLELKNTSKYDVKNNILIGILTGLTIFTKQSIGVFAFISMSAIAILKNKNDGTKKIKEEILAKILGILLVVLSMLVYFIITDSFFLFLNFCVGGLLDFGAQNTILQIPWTYLIIIFLAIAGVILSKEKEDKHLVILTITQICMISLIFPVTNMYHIFLSMVVSIPLLGCIMKNTSFNEKYKIIFMLFMFVLLCMQMESLVREYSVVESLFMGKLFASELVLTTLLIGFACVIVLTLFEKEKFSKHIIIAIGVFLFSAQLMVNFELQKNESIPVKLSVYKGLNLHKEAQEYLEDILQYIEEKEANGNEILFVSADASYYMAPLKRNNYIYDFALYGSLGFEGEEILINEIPQNSNVLILKNKHMMYQESELLNNFIKENYKKVDEIYDLQVFKKNN